MINISFSKLVLFFTLYSVVGWVCETVWCSVGERKIVNRGFLTGPWCPIYGFGALLILSITAPLPQNPLIIFLVSMVAASVLEYTAGWLLETLFQTRWWDYSQRRFNLKGRVCLRNSLLFGLMGLAVALYVHPAAEQLVALVQPSGQRVMASLIFVLLVLDFIHALYSISGMKARLQEMKALLLEMENYQKEYTWFDKSDPSGSIARLRTICSQETDDKEAALILEKIDNAEKRKGSGFRMLEAFPKMQPSGLLAEAETIRNEWKEEHLLRRQAGTVRRQEQLEKIKEAYKGVTFTRMVWVFFIGCILGYVVETIYCLATTGIIESRQGMVYGPFNQIYGFGAVIMVLLLTPLVSHGSIWVFGGGAIVGGVFESICSLIQELAFGSVSWEYSQQPFSLFGGRTNFVFMIFWGTLAVLYMKFIYPRMVRLIDSMPKRPKRFFTWVVAIFLSANMLLSAMAVGRWSKRVSNVTASNSIEMWLDENYPNEMLKEIYPNMQFMDKSEAEQSEAT